MEEQLLEVKNSFAHILVFLKCWKDNMGRKQIAAKELRIDENL